VANDKIATARAMGSPTPGCYVFGCGYWAWFAAVSGIVNVKPSISLA
jgi:hypothetical protein